MCDSPQLKESSFLEGTQENSIKDQEKSNMEFEFNETNSPGKGSVELGLAEELDSKSTGSPSPSSDLKITINKSLTKTVLSNSLRTTRSKDNPDFIAKQKSFMAKVQAASSGNCEPLSPSERPDTPGKRKRENNTIVQIGKKKKISRNDNGSQASIKEWQNDNCCWVCHREGQFICCEMCPRVFHLKCANLEKEPEEDWACSECHAVMQAENVENRSKAMQLISVDQLCVLLKYALNRLKAMPVMETFSKPVDIHEFPTYWDVVVHPVDFTSLEKNIKKKFYGSTEAFLSDARWIVHNSVIFNGANSKVTSLARTLIKILRQELSEIETCPDCYENAHKKPDRWFSEACRLAHPLVWARLKGFPFWPAKAVKWKDSNVDVRFFGRHDRSWVSLKECFLFSEQMPTPLKNRNKTLESCLVEVEEHIKKLKERFGKFRYAPHRLAFNPYDSEQIKLLLPLYKGPIMRMRSQSFSSRQSGHSGTDDETSSIASTDSGNSSYSRWKKRSIKDTSPGNILETETETDHSSMEEETANIDLIDESREEKEEEQLCNEDETKTEEDDDEEDENRDLKVDENLPPDKTVSHKAQEEEDGELEEELEMEDNDFKCVKVPPEERLKNMISLMGVNGEIDSVKDDHRSSSPEGVEKEATISSPASHYSNPNKVPDNDVSLTKKEKVGQLDSPFTTAGDCLNAKQENPSPDVKEGTVEEVVKTNLKTNSISMKVIKITQLKLKEAKSVGEDQISSVTLKTKVVDSERKDDDKAIPPLRNGGIKKEGSEKENNVLQDAKENSPKAETISSLENAVKGDSCQGERETAEKNVNSTKCSKLTANVVETNEEKVTISSQVSSTNFAESVDENIRNLERINELLRKEEMEMNDESSSPKKEGESASGASDSDSKNSSTKEIQTKSNKSFNSMYANDIMSKEGNSSSHNDAKEASAITKRISERTKDDEKPPKSQEEPNKRSTIDEMMDDDYFQGFLDEINLRKKVETYQKIIKNAQMRSPCENADEETSENNSEEDKDDREKEADKMSFEANNAFSEQLMTNSSLTIGKVSLPKSIKIQKMSGSRHSSYDEDFGTTKCPLPSVNIRSVLVGGKSGEDQKKEDSEEEEEQDKVSKEEEFMSKEAPSSLIDFQNYANKIFHNITISSKSMSGEKEAVNHTNKEKEAKSKPPTLSAPILPEENRSKSNHNLKNSEERESKERKASKGEEEERVLTEERTNADETPSLDAGKEASDSESLMEAVRLVKKIGNIAIKRVDGQTLEHSSGSDRVTISVASSSSSNTGSTTKVDSKESSASRTKTSTTTTITTTTTTSMKKPEKRPSSDNPLMGIGASVSVTKASDKEKEKEREKEKVKMPSGVDTTRLSPSISIIPVASSSSSTSATTEKSRGGRLSPTPVPASTPQSSATTTPTTTMTTVFSSSASPGFSMGSTTPSSSISASPNIPPPPLLSHSLPSPTGANVRGIIPPGLGLGGGPRTPITSPGLRMMGQPGMLIGNRHAGPPLARHLPPEAGPLSAELNKHAHKLAEMMRTSLEEVLGGLIGVGTPEARLAALQLELERCNWRHQQELIEVRHNADVMLVEMRANLEAEKQRAVDEARRQMEQKLVEIRRQMEVQIAEKIAEVRRQADIEKQRAIEETKKKQWCANCGKEALFFCCWNTSYCDYPCQQAHWPQHMSVCGQNSDSGGGGGQSNPEGGGESVNGDASTHSSRGATPVQSHLVGQVKNYIDDDEPYIEESKIRKKSIDNPSPIFSECMGRSISPAGSGTLVNSPLQQMGGTSPLGQPLAALGPGGMRPGMGAPSMAAIAAMSANPNAGHGMGMKMPRFMQHTMLQQQPLFGGMDPRMMMMMSRNMPGPAAAAMMRGHLQSFRPRFM